jgi:predicted acyltransferase
MAWLIVLVYTPGSGWRGHAKWWGWGNSDAFFPAFLFIAGAGLAYQVRDKQMPWPRLARRFVILVVLGIALNAVLADGATWETVRVPGVLQRVGLVGIGGAIVVVVLRRRWRLVLVASVAVAFGWAAVLASAAADCPGGEPTPDGCGTLISVDEAAFGAEHLYHSGTAGHDPEGLPSTLGALATFLTGFAAGRMLHEARGRPLIARLARLLAMAALWAVLIGPLLTFQPVGKRLWTGSYVAVTAVGCLVLLAVLMVLFDSRTGGGVGTRVRRVASAPFTAVGRNALVVWVSIYLLDKLLTSLTRDELTVKTWYADTYGPWAYFATFGLLLFVLAAVLDWRRLYVRL